MEFAQNGAHQGGFSGSDTANHGEQFAVRNGEVDAGEKAVRGHCDIFLKRL